MSSEINEAVKRGKKKAVEISIGTGKEECNRAVTFSDVYAIIEAMSEPYCSHDWKFTGEGVRICRLCGFEDRVIPSPEPEEELGIPVCGNDGCKIVGCDGSCVKPSPEPCKHIFTFDKPCSIENVCVKCGFIEQPSPDYKQLYLDAMEKIKKLETGMAYYIKYHEENP